ncbi:translation initiation factor IF-2-like, partial [Panicum virgatum]|uniref:translation initiation factor IF-2-like n=1 Tax=Panicum virgatum TaxID=38727 RepID=UPI0019D54D67
CPRSRLRGPAAPLRPAALERRCRPRSDRGRRPRRRRPSSDRGRRPRVPRPQLSPAEQPRKLLEPPPPTLLASSPARGPASPCGARGSRCLRSCRPRRRAEPRGPRCATAMALPPSPSPARVRRPRPPSSTAAMARGGGGGGGGTAATRSSGRGGSGTAGTRRGGPCARRGRHRACAEGAAIGVRNRAASRAPSPARARLSSMATAERTGRPPLPPLRGRGAASAGCSGRRGGRSSAGTARRARGAARRPRGVEAASSEFGERGAASSGCGTGGKGRSSTRARRGGRGGARVGALGAELHRGFRGKGGRAGAKLDQNSKGGGAERRRGAPPKLGVEVVRAVMYVGAGAPPR